MNIPREYLIGGAVGLGVLLSLWWIGKRTASAVAKGIDITSSDNVVASAVDKAGAAVSGNPGWSLGVWAWEVLNPEAAASAKAGSGPSTAPKKKPAGKPATKPAAKRTGPTVGGSWGAPAVMDDNPPSVLNPGSGGTGGSFEQMSKPWSY